MAPCPPGPLLSSAVTSGGHIIELGEIKREAKCSVCAGSTPCAQQQHETAIVLRSTWAASCSVQRVLADVEHSSVSMWEGQIHCRPCPGPSAVETRPPLCAPMALHWDQWPHGPGAPLQSWWLLTRFRTARGGRSLLARLVATPVKLLSSA